jgi:hypothetical protein
MDGGELFQPNEELVFLLFYGSWGKGPVVD